MKKKLSLTQYVKSKSIFFILMLVGTLFIIDLIFDYVEYRDNVQQMKQQHYESQKTSVRAEVIKVFDEIQYERSRLEELTKGHIQQRVYDGHAVAEHLYQKYHGKISDDRIKEMIIESLRPIRYAGGSGYYFITRTDGVEILFSDKPGLEGKNLLDLKDTKGNFVIRDMINVVTNKNEGFYSYYWTKPNTEGNFHQKISYVKYFEPFQWIIGTGLYADDYEEEIQNELLEEIGSKRFGTNDNGYIFVVSYDGVTLMNGVQRHLIGKNVWELTDPNGVKVIQEERRAVENTDGEFITYSWHNPNTGSVSEKITFMKGMKDWQWMVGAGFYVDDVKPLIEDSQLELNNRTKIHFIGYLVVFGCILIFLMQIYGRFSQKLLSDFSSLKDFLKTAAQKKSMISTTDIRFVEFEEVAEYANQMLESMVQAEQRLEEMNRTLQERIITEIKKNQLHEKLLFEQKRFADMGQMINAIAHQWRQPLNNIHLTIQMMQDIDEGEDYGIPKPDLYKQHDELVQYMSRTIDDFRNYFSTKKEKHEFSIMDEIKKSLSLVEAQLQSHDIEVELIYDVPDCSTKNPNYGILFGFSREFRQVVMNLLANAKDAILEWKAEEPTGSPKISIMLKLINGEYHITFENTGKPIPQDVLPRIFQPYYTTKEEGKGTGIGLYMSKTIIENDMDGKIYAKNTETGVIFYVCLKPIEDDIIRIEDSMDELG